MASSPTPAHRSTTTSGSSTMASRARRGRGPSSTSPRLALGRLVEKALDQAETLRYFDLRGIERGLDRSPARAGSKVLRSILGSYAIGQDIQRSESEELLRSICLRHGIPLPHCNVPMNLGERWIEADFFWPAERLVVELTGSAGGPWTEASE